MMRASRHLTTLIAAMLLLCAHAHAEDHVEHVIESVTNDVTLNWEWLPQYQVLPTVSGSGAIDGLPPDTWVDEGPLALEAVPDAYHQFDGWTGHTNTTANPLTLDVDHPVTNLTATFSPLLTARGTPHAWLAGFGLEPDDDEQMMADGFAVWQHYIADTNPTNPASFFPPIRLDPLLTGLLLTIDPTSTNRRYHIVSRTNLLGGGWAPVTNAPGTGGPWSIELPIPDTAPTFYRGKVTLP